MWHRHHGVLAGHSQATICQNEVVGQLSLYQQVPFFRFGEWRTTNAERKVRDRHCHLISSNEEKHCYDRHDSADRLDGGDWGNWGLA